VDCLILEDQVLLADLLSVYLGAFPGIYIKGVAHDVAQGLELTRRFRPDLLIADLVLPDGYGVDVAAELLKQKPVAKIIVLSAECHRLVCSRHLHESIIAVLDKTQALDLLRDQVLELLDAERRGPTRQLAQRASSDSLTFYGIDPWPYLTRREQEIFLLIGTGLTTDTIAERLSISLLTARTHRKNITAKLGIKGSELVLLASACKGLRC
jgi:DNA-binding NarL/FixJ family response regulator